MKYGIFTGILCLAVLAAGFTFISQMGVPVNSATQTNPSLCVAQTEDGQCYAWLERAASDT